MKTLIILFEEPNVFKVLPEWPNYPEQTFDTKANGIIISNPEVFAFKSIYGWVGRNKNTTIYKLGDIFQVEGYEYSIRNVVTCTDDRSLSEDGLITIKVATLKLAKEEEPKELDDLHNRIMTQWQRNYGSIHSEQKMDAYTISGFIRELLKK